MKCRYETRMTAICPHIAGVTDLYDVVVEADRMILVEDMMNEINRHSGKAYQEQITEQLAEALSATVTTIGYHSGIKTTVIAP